MFIVYCLFVCPYFFRLFDEAKIQFFQYAAKIIQKIFSLLIFSKLQTSDGQKNGKKNGSETAKMADFWQKSQKTKKIYYLA